MLEELRKVADLGVGLAVDADQADLPRDRFAAISES